MQRLHFSHDRTGLDFGTVAKGLECFALTAEGRGAGRAAVEGHGGPRPARILVGVDAQLGAVQLVLAAGNALALVAPYTPIRIQYEKEKTRLNKESFPKLVLCRQGTTFVFS